MKLCCIFGNHHYSLFDTKVHRIAETDKAIAFRADSYCVDCGKKRYTFFKINRDEFLKKEPPKETSWYDP